jgi:hypothetical protein
MVFVHVDRRSMIYFENLSEKLGREDAASSERAKEKIFNNGSRGRARSQRKRSAV